MGHGSGGPNVVREGRARVAERRLRPEGRVTLRARAGRGTDDSSAGARRHDASSEFWNESRGRPTPSFTGVGAARRLAVVAGPAAEGEASAVPSSEPAPAQPGRRRSVRLYHRRVVVDREIFRVVVERHSAEEAALRFEWLDRVAPTRPRLVVRAPGRGRVHLTWDSSVERGSGVDTYSVLLDGRVVRTLTQQLPFSGWSASLHLSRGVHRIAVLATDRAGNRGRAATARVRVA